MKKLLDDIKKLNILYFRYNDEIEELKKSNENKLEELRNHHKKETKELVNSIKKHEDLIFPLAEKHFVDIKFKKKCDKFIKKYGELTEPIKNKLFDECKDISNIFMKLEEDGIVFRRITKVIITISYDDLELKSPPILKLICNN